jgi:hypothetical protein
VILYFDLQFKVSFILIPKFHQDYMKLFQLHTIFCLFTGTLLEWTKSKPLVLTILKRNFLDNFVRLTFCIAHLILMQSEVIWEPSWLWSYGGWIYNYLYNQCLSPLKLWVRIPLMARWTWMIQHYVIKFVCDLWQVSGFLWVLQFPPPVKLTATI